MLKTSTSRPILDSRRYLRPNPRYLTPCPPSPLSPSSMSLAQSTRAASAEADYTKGPPLSDVLPTPTQTSSHARGNSWCRRQVLSNTKPAILMLWCIFEFYLFVFITHRDSVAQNPMLIYGALGIGATVGVALNANGYAMMADASAGHGDDGVDAGAGGGRGGGGRGAGCGQLCGYITGKPFAVMRFFLIPFCVSSYSSIISSEAHINGSFIWLFPNTNPHGEQLITGVPDSLVACIVVAVTILASVISRYMVAARPLQVAGENV